jgi:ribokinase
VIVVFGSINLDLIFNLPAIPRPGETVLGPSTRIEPGGKGANQAVAAARAGAETVMAGAVGRDALADGALRLLRDAGVDLDRVASVDATTGCAAISVDPGGNNAIAVGSGANLLATASQVEVSLLGAGATMVLQMEVPAAENAALIVRAQAGGARVVLNLAPASPLDAAALRAVDVLVVNETEGEWLAEHLGCAATAAALNDCLAGVAVVLTSSA